MSPRRVALVLAGVILLATPVAAHGNYVSADAQVSADGTVRLELVVIVTDGFVALHADDGGEPGAVVGHRGFDAYVNHDYAVGIEPAYWANRTGPTALWAVLHRDTGNGQFDPADDPPLRSASDDSLVAARFSVRPGPGPINVVAERDAAQETDRNQVTLRTVRLAADGYVVLRANDGDPGAVVGHRQLSAGEHSRINVTLDEDFYETRPEEFALWAAVHRSDGDGRFDAANDTAVTVGDATVTTRFAVVRTDPIERTPTATPPTATDSGHDAHDHDHTATESAPSATASGHDSHEHTATGRAEAPATEPGAGQAGTPTAAPDVTTEAPGQPGFGVLAVLVALLGLAAIAGRRRG